jgi:hypothetical protein
MDQKNAQKANCLCGSVKIAAANINPQFTVCHCDDCRAWGSGPFFAVQCGSEVSFEGEQHISEYESSAWASRAFCSNCGTHLYYRLKKDQSYNMPVGLFPMLQNLTMDMQYFSDKRPDYYCFSNNSKEMTSEQIYAYFADQV